MAYVANVFENYHMTMETVLKYPDTYASPEYLKLLQTVKIYFDSFVWVSDDTDRMIYLYSGKGLDSSTIASYLDMNANTYRSRVSRISAKLCSTLFQGMTLSELCLSGSLEVVMLTRKRIGQLNNRLVIGKELSGHILEKIYDITANIIQEQPVTEEEKFQALLLLTSFSEPAINHKMSQVNPSALSVVMDELFNSEVSDWCLYYKRMQSKVSELKMLSQKTIDACKNE